MGRRTRAMHEEAERREQAVMARLSAHSQRVRAPEPRVRPAEQMLTPLMREWWPYYVRRPEDWVCRTRSHDVRRQRLDLLRHLFQVYRAPRFLEALWEDTPQGRPNPEAKEFASWYVAVATGQSLYKECARPLLSRRECHLFLNAPDDQGVVQNIWWARAVASGAALGTACTIARSKLARQRPADEFWQATMRFFARFPVKLAEMDDLLDYLDAAHRENPHFTLKGRSLDSVREGSEAWHRLQARMKEHGQGAWGGAALPDWACETGRVDKGTLVTWRVTQITTGKDLVREGTAQHHCVGTYKAKCVAGRCSIWSMTREDVARPLEGRKRTLTIELDSNFVVVQARGYANRSPRPDEEAVLRAWMAAHGLSGGHGRW